MVCGIRPALCPALYARGACVRVGQDRMTARVGRRKAVRDVVDQSASRNVAITQDIFCCTALWRRN